MQELEVKIPVVEAGGYKIKIGTDILGSLYAQIQTEFAAKNNLIVTDENVVAAGHLKKFLKL